MTKITIEEISTLKVIRTTFESEKYESFVIPQHVVRED
jgi:hypothetical protein